MTKKGIITIVCVIAIIAAGIFGYISIESRAVDASSKATQIFTVESGEGATQIGTQLKSKGLIRSYKVFMIRVKMGGNTAKMQAGSYAFSKSMSEIGRASCRERV